MAVPLTALYPCSPLTHTTAAPQVIALLFRQQAAEHFGGTVTSFNIEVLTECASIIKRLAGEAGGCGGREAACRVRHVTACVPLPLPLP